MPEQKTTDELLAELSQTCSEIVETQAAYAQSVSQMTSKLAKVDQLETTVGGFDTRITNAQDRADKGVSDAATAQSTASAIATSSTLGRVKVDDETIKVDENGTLSSEAKGGGGRNIGEVFYSLIPLVDATVHLLNGGIIYQEGIYKNFVDYMEDLYDDGNHTNLFCTEAQFQTSINTYGVCGKFVYDGTNKTLRLPKVTGFIEGTVVESAIGDLVEAGLPNIEGEAGLLSGYGLLDYPTNISGALTNGTPTSNAVYSATDLTQSSNLKIDASLSNSIYGNSSTVQPQAIKGYVYIVLANAVKTQVEVDIDEIATDLNGKADVDLTNCTKPHVIETWHSGTEWYRVWSDGWIEQGGTVPASGTTNYASGTITFNKSFSNTNYKIFLQNSMNASYGYAESIYNKTTSNVAYRQFVVQQGGDWFACGY